MLSAAAGFVIILLHFRENNRISRVNSDAIATCWSTFPFLNSVGRSVLSKRRRHVPHSKKCEYTSIFTTTFRRLTNFSVWFGTVVLEFLTSGAHQRLPGCVDELMSNIAERIRTIIQDNSNKRCTYVGNALILMVYFRTMWFLRNSLCHM
jgi:hypothetical protein